MKKEKIEKLAAAWAHAAEQAQQNQTREQEVADNELKHTAVFAVKSTIKAGRYSAILSCNNC